MKKIAVVGTVYVGLSLAVLLARHHTVVALDIDAAKVAKINQRILPIEAEDIAHGPEHEPLQLQVTLNAEQAHAGARSVIVANRVSDSPHDVAHKVYSRDLFGVNS